MARPRVIIFARAPRYGAVKSRLARELGPAETLRFYRTTLASLLRTVGNDPRWETVIALTPDAAATPAEWTGAKRVVSQGDGDLGRRMLRALRKTGARRPTVVIGSDIPDITPARLSAAFRALGRTPYVLGPTPDGGYWLIGAQHPERLQRHALDGVRWSTHHARADTIVHLDAANVALLPFELEDIDDASAYRRWRERLGR